MHVFVSQSQRVLEHELYEQGWLWETKDAEVGVAANLAREKPVFTAE